MEIPAAWQSAITTIKALPDGATVLFVGTIDRGKTTLATLAARSLTLDGLRVAVVDTDIGQSEIGPPGTVGIAAVKSDWAKDTATKLSDLRPAATYFVGAFAPPSVALELVVATAQAVRFAKDGKAQRILVDTTGYAIGPAARRLKVAKAQVIAPALIVGIGQGGEITSLLSAMSAASGATVLALEMPPEVGRKSPGFRATRRLTRLAKALDNGDGAHELALPLQNISLVGASLTGGVALPPELIRWAANTLRVAIVRAEQSEATLTLFVEGKMPRLSDSATAPLAAHFRVQNIRFVALAAYANVYIGLHDANGRLLTVGCFLRLDAENAEIIVSAPPSLAPERVKLVVFGRVRVQSDGTFLGDVRPGEI